MVCAVCAAALTGPTFPERTIPPVDNAGKHPDLKTFLNDLSTAVENKDVKQLLAHVDENIKIGFDAENGKANFTRNWGLDTGPAKSVIWKELGDVLRLGGAYSEENGTARYIAPYMFAKWPDEFDSFEYAAITGENVTIRSGPSRTAAAIKTVSYLIVHMEEIPEEIEETINGETHPWRKIGLPDGRKGFVWGKYARSPVSYRAGFERTNGFWKLTFFLAGD